MPSTSNHTNNKTNTPSNAIQRQLLKLEKQCTQLTAKLRLQEERLQAQDEQMEAILQIVIAQKKKEASLKPPETQQRKKKGIGRIPMRQLSIGDGLFYLLNQHAGQPLANELLDLSAIECPFGSTSHDGTAFWRTAMLMADSLWTGSERQCMIDTARGSDNDESKKQEIQAICDSIDRWAVRLTSVVCGKGTGFLKPYIMGLAHNLDRGEQVFLLRTYKVEWTSPEAQARYRDTTPLREWIVEQELARKEKQLSEDAVDPTNTIGDDDEPETKRARVEDEVI